MIVSAILVVEFAASNAIDVSSLSMMFEDLGGTFGR